MANISTYSRAFVEKHLSDALETVRSARYSVPADQMNFDRALRVLEECRAAIQHTEDIDLVATHLRAASRALEHYCSGPTKACVSSAIHLIDKAIGGESFQPARDTEYHDFPVHVALRESTVTQSRRVVHELGASAGELNRDCYGGTLDVDVLRRRLEVLVIDSVPYAIVVRRQPAVDMRTLTSGLLASCERRPEYCYGNIADIHE